MVLPSLDLRFNRQGGKGSAKGASKTDNRSEEEGENQHFDRRLVVGWLFVVVSYCGGSYAWVELAYAPPAASVSATY